MDSPNSSIFSQKLKEFYWTVTRAVGLGHLHDGSSNKYQNGLLRLLFYPLYAVAARVLSYAGVRCFSDMGRKWGCVSVVRPSP